MIKNKTYGKVLLLGCLLGLSACELFDKPRRPSPENPSFYELGYKGPVEPTQKKDEKQPVIICPAVSLENASYSKLILNGNDYQVNLVRDESYCHISQQVNHSYIEVKPIFQLRQSKLEQYERKIPFSYYIRTPDGRTRVFKQEAYIPKMKTEICHSGKSTKIDIPEKEKFFYPITIGLIIEQQELEYNNKYFNYHYEK